MEKGAVKLVFLMARILVTGKTELATIFLAKIVLFKRSYMRRT
jgi:hypothetical protein